VGPSSGEPEEEQPAQPRPAITITDEQLEEWVYGPGGADRARQRLESRLSSEIQQVDELSGLTPEQKKKLELAGRGDIKRLLDRAREKMAVIGRARGDPLQARAILVELQPLRVDLNAHVFGDGSMFAKTLTKTLTSEQRARREDMKRLASYRLRVQWVVFPLDKQLRLSQEQHRRFVAVIVAGTRPLKRYGEYDDDAVMLQASKLPEAKLRPIFDEAQWRKLCQRFDQARQMENILIENGYLPEQEPEVPRPAAVKEPAKRKTAKIPARVGAPPGSVSTGPD